MARKDVDARRTSLLIAQQELATHRRLLSTNERDIADIRARLASIPIEIASAKADARKRRGGPGAAKRRVRSAQAAVRHRADQRSDRRVAGRGRTNDRRWRCRRRDRAGGRSARGGAARSVPCDRLRADRPGRADQPAGLSLPALRHRAGTDSARCRPRCSRRTRSSIQGLNIQEPTFRIRVVMARDSMQAYGETFPLQPGMLVSADVVFDRRNLLPWLFDPIYAVTGRT